MTTTPSPLKTSQYITDNHPASSPPCLVTHHSPHTTYNIPIYHSSPLPHLTAWNDFDAIPRAASNYGPNDHGGSRKRLLFSRQQVVNYCHVFIFSSCFSLSSSCFSLLTIALYISLTLSHSLSVSLYPFFLSSFLSLFLFLFFLLF